MGVSVNIFFIYQILNEVLEGRVHYIVEDSGKAVLPFIVYQEINKRSAKYHDDHAFLKVSTIQISLVTDGKNIELEKKLENKLTDNGIDYQMVSEYNLGRGIYRIYEIKMEEFKYEQ